MVLLLIYNFCACLSKNQQFPILILTFIHIEWPVIIKYSDKVTKKIKTSIKYLRVLHKHYLGI